MASSGRPPENRAVGGLSKILGQLAHEETTLNRSDPRTSRFTSLIAMATLIGAVPPDPRLGTIHQVITIAVPDLLETGPFRDALQTWPGGNADSALSMLTDIAITQARTVLAARPERALAHRNYLRRFGLSDLIGVGSD